MNNQIFIIILLILSLGTSSCSDLDYRTNLEFENLVQSHSNQTLFLSFWSNMNEKDFKRVTKLENEKGNLINGQFIVQIPYEPSYFDYLEVDFDIVNQSNSITLKYHDEHTIEWSGTRIPYGDGLSEQKKYAAMRAYFVNLFDTKYKRISPMTWKINRVSGKDKVVRLYCRINAFEGKTNGGIQFFGQHVRGDEFIMAECDIKITYSTFKYYKDQIESQTHQRINIEQQELQEKKEIHDHNNKL